MTPRLQNGMPAHCAINTFIFLKRIEKKIIFCWRQFTGKAMNLCKSPIKKNAQTFPKMRDVSFLSQIYSKDIIGSGKEISARTFIETFLKILFLNSNSKQKKAGYTATPVAYGPYLRSLHHFGRSSEAKNRKKNIV